MVSGSGGVCAQRFGIEVDDARNQAAVGKEAAIHSERSRQGCDSVKVLPWRAQRQTALRELAGRLVRRALSASCARSSPSAAAAFTARRSALPVSPAGRSCG